MDEFEAKIKISKEVHQHASGCKSGAFEVYVNGDLIHSKMTIKGHGKVQTDEELDNIIDNVNKRLSAPA